MKERPILFSGAMVRAILDGPKTVTRRVAKLTLDGRVREVGGHRNWHVDDPNAVLACPYGAPGDRLWVRETWGHTRQPAGDGCCQPRYMNPAYPWDLRFRADGVEPSGGRWRPSIHMPRWASRITLEVTGVRVDRLQEISEEDAKAEGATLDPLPGTVNGEPATLHAMSHKQAFIWLWDSINGARPGCAWADNPWLWVVEFKRLVTP